MSFNIVDLVKDQVKGQLIGHIGGLLGNEGGKATGAVDSMIPALLQGITGTTATSEGANKLFGAVQNQDDSLMDNMGALLGGGQASTVIDSGNSVLSSLFGDGGIGKLAGALSGFSGLSKGGTSSLMGMLAPIIIGVIKRKVMGGGLDVGGLTSMLAGQSNNISAAIPQGLSDQLNTSGFLSSIGGAGSAATAAVSSAATSATNSAQAAVNTAGEQVEKGGSVLRWLAPLAILGALAWAAFTFLLPGAQDATNGLADKVSEGAAAVTDTAASATDAVTDAASGAVAEATDAASGLAGGLDPSALGDQVGGLFSTATDTLGGITDLESAQAAVPALTDLGSQVTSVSGMLDKLPEAARGPIGAIAGDGIGQLQPMVDKVLAIPGVGSVLSPIVGPIMETLQGFGG